MNMLRITGVVSEQYLKELMDGRAGFNGVEWHIQHLEEE